MANQAAPRVGLGLILLILASMMAMIFGVMAMESILSPGPTIPDPGQLIGEIPPPKEAQRTTKLSPQVLTLFVYPKDADRLARTIVLDVVRHGGQTIHNGNDRNITFAVSQQYLERLEPLVDSPGTIRQTGTAYALWAAREASKPDPELVREPPDTALYINLAYPLTAHPGTLPMMAVGGSVIGAAFLAMLICVIVYQTTKPPA